MFDSGWWYLSFATEDAFLGAAIVAAPDMPSACMRAAVLGINPGGEVLGVPIKPEQLDATPAEYTDRLLTKTQALCLDDISAKTLALHVAATCSDMTYGRALLAASDQADSDGVPVTDVLRRWMQQGIHGGRN